MDEGERGSREGNEVQFETRLCFLITDCASNLRPLLFSRVQRGVINGNPPHERRVKEVKGGVEMKRKEGQKELSTRRPLQVIGRDGKRGDTRVLRRERA